MCGCINDVDVLVKMEFGCTCYRFAVLVQVQVYRVLLYVETH